MSVKLNELVKQVRTGDIRLVAGKNGFSNPVEWVHMVGNTEIANFLSGGEVVFTTGLGISEKMSLLELVQSVYHNDASGMVVNVGPYVPEIGQEVIDFCNEHDFPIFEVPWRVHMSDIMRMFCMLLIQSEQKAMELSAAFRHAIFAPNQEELYVPVLMQKGFFPDWNYYTALVEVTERITAEDGHSFYSQISNDRLEFILKRTMRVITQENYETIAFVEKERIVVVISDRSEAAAMQQLEMVKNEIGKVLKETEAIFLSLGSLSKGLRKIADSYRMSKKVIDLSKFEHMENQVQNYNTMGICRLLFQIENMEIIEEYYNATIKALDEYDALNDSNLVEVLSCYMKNNGSVQETADELFVHRNTVNYKMKKIESLLGVNISRFDTRNELAMGIMAGKLRKIYM